MHGWKLISETNPTWHAWMKAYQRNQPNTTCMAAIGWGTFDIGKQYSMLIEVCPWPPRVVQVVWLVYLSFMSQVSRQYDGKETTNVLIWRIRHTDTLMNNDYEYNNMHPSRQCRPRCLLQHALVASSWSVCCFSIFACLSTKMIPFPLVFLT